MQNPPEGILTLGTIWRAAEDASEQPFTLSRRSEGVIAALMLLFLNTTAGIAIISQAAPMTQEITGADAAQAAGPVGIISIANGAGRFFWAWPSDAIGRRWVFLLMFPIQALAFLVFPSVHSLGTFTVLACLVLLC